jgi:hypothetical protein
VPVAVCFLLIKMLCSFIIMGLTIAVDDFKVTKCTWNIYLAVLKKTSLGIVLLDMLDTILQRLDTRF